MFVQYKLFIGFACAGVESVGRVVKGRIVLHVRVDSRHFDITYRFVRMLSARRKLEPPTEMEAHSDYGPNDTYMQE